MTRATATTFTLVVLAAAAFVVRAPGPTRANQEQVIRMTAKKFEYSPSEITVKKGVPVVLEITSLDRDHGFKLSELGIRADIQPNSTTRVRFVPDKAGRYPFECDVFCGSGHEEMSGELVVVE